MDALKPLVSIAIPCYRQLPLARRAIDTIRNQSLTDIEIILLDDGASDEYRDYVDALGDRRVRYHRNPERLGAMQNMFAAIGAGSGEYVMAFHEDDLLSPGYLSTAVGILGSHPSCAFVACQLREFTHDPSPEDLARDISLPAYEKFESASEFVRGILRGTADPMFGSTVYRRAALAGVRPDHQRYATLVDRPFLLSIVERGWTAAVIREPLAWYRRHASGEDTRHLAMTADHVLNLIDVYRSKLRQPLNAEDRALLFSYSGYWLFELYRLTPPADRPAVWRFLFRAWRRGLYNPRARGRFGIRQIQRALVNRTS